MTSIPRRVHSCVSAPSILRLYRLHHSIACIQHPPLLPSWHFETPPPPLSPSSLLGTMSPVMSFVWVYAPAFYSGFAHPHNLFWATHLHHLFWFTHLHHLSWVYTPASFLWVSLPFILFGFTHPFVSLGLRTCIFCLGLRTRLFYWVYTPVYLFGFTHPHISFGFTHPFILFGFMHPYIFVVGCVCYAPLIFPLGLFILLYPLRMCVQLAFGCYAVLCLGMFIPTTLPVVAPIFVFESTHPYPLRWDDPYLLGAFFGAPCHHLDYTPVNLVWALSHFLFGWACTAGAYIPTNFLFGTIYTPLYFRLIVRQPAHLFSFWVNYMFTTCTSESVSLFHLVIQMLPTFCNPSFG